MLRAITLKIFVLCLVLCLLGEGRVSAHSHVWVHHGVTIHFDQNGLAGFKQEWVFDEMFSNMIIHDFDKNQDGQFEPTEIKAVEKGAFSNLKNFEYFTHIKIDGKPFKVNFVKDFKAEIVNNVVVYHFFVPCHVKALSSFKEIRLALYDKSFYTSLTLVKERILFKNDLGFEHKHRVELNKDEPYYYGQVYPEEVILRFRKKP
jgi:ABC-type uncharacterized transport system substrate-binding protein